MAKTIERPKTLYDEDFYAWLRRQAELLRVRRFDELDLDNLIEEIEALGRSERRAVESRVQLILVHLLKLACSPAQEPRRGWLRTVLIHRHQLHDQLTPTLRRHLAGRLSRLYAHARRLAALELETDGIEPDQLPLHCPFSLDEILDDGWLPSNIYDADRDQGG